MTPPRKTEPASSSSTQPGELGEHGGTADAKKRFDEDKYRYPRCVPLDNDGIESTALSKTVERWRHAIDCHFKSTPEVPLALMVHGERGTGKTTFLKALRDRLERKKKGDPDRADCPDNDPQFVPVWFDPLDIRGVNKGLSPEHCLYYEVAKGVEDYFKDRQKKQNRTNLRRDKSNATEGNATCFGKLWAELWHLHLSEEAAAQAAIAFAADKEDFAKIYAEKSSGSVTAVKVFIDQLQEALKRSPRNGSSTEEDASSPPTENSSADGGYVLALFIDDTDLTPWATVPLLTAALRIRERAKRVLVLAAGDAGHVRMSLKKQLRYYGAGQNEYALVSLTSKLTGQLIHLAHLNPSRCVQFLGAAAFPEAGARTNFDGRFVWIPFLLDRSPNEDAQRDLLALLAHLDAGDLVVSGRVANKPLSSAKAVKEALANHRVGLGDEHSDEEVRRKVEDLLQPHSRDKETLDFFAEISTLLPRTYREATLLTNLLIDVRRQWIRGEYPLDRSLGTELLEARRYRFLSALAMQKWGADDPFVKLFWHAGWTAYHAIRSGALNVEKKGKKSRSQRRTQESNTKQLAITNELLFTVINERRLPSTFVGYAKQVQLPPGPEREEKKMLFELAAKAAKGSGQRGRGKNRDRS